MELLTINIDKLQFCNADAANNLIRYISRTRINEDRRHELLSFGFNYPYPKPVEQIIHEFEYIQDYYHSDGCLMCHYCLRFPLTVDPRFKNNIHRINAFAQDCCLFIFNMGHQCCYAVHTKDEDTDDIHIHLAINTVNFMTGKKLRQYYKEIHNTVEKPLSTIFNDHHNRIYPCYAVGTLSLDDL